MELRSNYKMTYNVDLVFCIDATGSMEYIIDIVKKNALNLYQDIVDKMRQRNKVLEKVRVRVIGFRDYLEDGDEAMLTSDFFELPARAEDLKSCMQYIEAKGGGDIPEDGLEALAYAIRSPWEQKGIKKRHVIVVWTDAPAHELGYGSAAPNYPANMARNFEELTLWWDGPQHGGYMDQHAKRLMMFAPAEYKDGENIVRSHWDTISRSWDNAILAPVVSDKGLEEWQYDEILSAICNTI